MSEIVGCIYQISLNHGPAKTAWIDVTKDEYDDAGLYDEYERRTLYTEASFDALTVLEMLAAEADAGTVMIPSGLRLTIDAALIKGGRKAAPVRNGD